MAAVLVLIAAGGCAMFDREKWDLNRFRDERALDIDQRLEANTPIVENPF